jgi:hypothetical protein
LFRCRPGTRPAMIPRTKPRAMQAGRRGSTIFVSKTDSKSNDSYSLRLARIDAVHFLYIYIHSPRTARAEGNMERLAHLI